MLLCIRLHFRTLDPQRDKVGSILCLAGLNAASGQSRTQSWLQNKSISIMKPHWLQSEVCNSINFPQHSAEIFLSDLITAVVSVLLQSTLAWCEPTHSSRAALFLSFIPQNHFLSSVLLGLPAGWTLGVSTWQQQSKSYGLHTVY